MDHGIPLSPAVPAGPGALWRSTRRTAYGLLAICLLQSPALRAQTTGLDFTANDCAGAPHHLFSELDSGSVVVLDLVMMNCPDCAPATVAIANDVIPNTIDPARGKFYSIGFDDLITCQEMTSWALDGGVNHPVFAGMSAQTAYYGGMGMPTIVVLGGGSNHWVYYQHLGYVTGLNPIITSSIDQALLAAIGVEEHSARTIILGPNPTASVLYLQGSYVAVKVMDLAGRVVLLRAGDLGSALDVSTLLAGEYIVEFIAADRSRAIGRFERLY